MNRVPSALREASPTTHEQSIGVKKRMQRIRGMFLRSHQIKSTGSSVRSVIMYSRHDSTTSQMTTGVHTVLEKDYVKTTPVKSVTRRVSPVIQRQSVGVKKRTL
jgi:hypothetical protein